MLDSEASTTIFKSVSETAPNTFEADSDTIVYFAACDEPISCLGVGDLKPKELSIPDSLHASNLKDTLVSVSRICDEGHIVVFTRSEAIIFSTRTVSVLVGDILAVVRGDFSSTLYVFSASKNGNKKTSRQKHYRNNSKRNIN